MMIVHKKQEKGFTLIEILIAIALLGILSAVVIPNVTGYLSKGEEQAFKSDVASVQAAVDNYYGDPTNRGASGANKGKKLYPLKGTEAEKVSGGTILSTDGLVWTTATVGFLIDFTKLVGTSGNYLKSVPASVAVDNGTSYTGSYAYYVDTNGKVGTKWTGDRTNAANAQVAGIYP